MIQRPEPCFGAAIRALAASARVGVISLASLAGGAPTLAAAPASASVSAPAPVDASVPAAARAPRSLTVARAQAEGQPGTAPVAEAQATALLPFEASFVLEWKGMNAASASLDLTRQGDGTWRYVSRNNARGLFRAVFPGELTQVSRLQIEGGQVRPLSYRGDDGSSDQSRDVALDFDWNRRRVTGVAEKRPVDLELQPGLQDVMSVQIALLVDLLAGRKPTGYDLVDKDRIKDYVYTDEGKTRVATVLGTLDTVVWSSHRPNSDRVTRVWYAPSRGFAPVKAERRRGDRLEWSMRLVSLQR